MADFFSCSCWPGHELQNARRPVTNATYLNDTALNAIFHDKFNGLYRSVLSETMYAVHGLCSATISIRFPTRWKDAYGIRPRGYVVRLGSQSCPLQ